uniref:Uncharacterized protein n=1 Tax=Amphimedon queenslandica TaxID=400682 RepID=A0A1X7UWZ0_AMPQE
MDRLLPRLSLGLAFGFAIGIIIFVHRNQKSDRERMKEGVVRDMERQERKKQNLLLLKEQQELEQKLKQRNE